MDQPTNSKDLYFQLLRYVAPYWKAFAISIASTVVLAMTEPAIPALMKPLLDGSFIEKDPETIRLMPVLLIALFLVRGVSNYISTIGLNLFVPVIGVFVLFHDPTHGRQDRVAGEGFFDKIGRA